MKKVQAQIGQNRLLSWLDARFPWRAWWTNHASEYYAPKNFNFWYYFGSLALVVLVMQLLSGLWLTMFYIPSPAQAFASVESIMRDVKFGWILRYMHSTGASFFFIVVYLHMFRAFLYGSYKNPRELIWLIGMLLYLALMAEAFMGYLLPWGQMSYWGAQVITSLFGAIPGIGDPLVLWIRGDYTVSGATLSRFFALHIIGIPLVLLGLVLFHISALHKVGSNNPEGIEIHNKLNELGHPKDGIAFHPYYTVKDLFALGVFLFLFCAVMFFAPTGGGYFLEKANFAPANVLQTPDNIVPVWYMTPYYAILRAIPNKLIGVLAMFSAIAILFFVPWLDKNPVKSIRYRGLAFKIVLFIFAFSFIALGYLGTVHVSNTSVILARLFTVLYFAFFLYLPFYKYFEAKSKRRAQRIHK